MRRRVRLPGIPTFWIGVVLLIAISVAILAAHAVLDALTSPLPPH